MSVQDLVTAIGTLDDVLAAHAKDLGPDFTGADWQGEIATTILEHHKLTSLRGDASSLAESFRQADWIDVTRGLRTFGLRRAYVREVFGMWPDAGFHKRLLELSLRRLRTHPWSPLPMLRF